MSDKWPLRFEHLELMMIKLGHAPGVSGSTPSVTAPTPMKPALTYTSAPFFEPLIGLSEAARRTHKVWPTGRAICHAPGDPTA